MPELDQYAGGQVSNEHVRLTLEIARHLTTAHPPLAVAVEAAFNPDAAIRRAWNACTNPLALVDVYGWALPMGQRVELGPVRYRIDAWSRGSYDYVLKVERIFAEWECSSVWLHFTEGQFFGGAAEPDRYMHTCKLYNDDDVYTPAVRELLGRPPTLAELLEARGG